MAFEAHLPGGTKFPDRRHRHGLNRAPAQPARQPVQATKISKDFYGVFGFF